MKPKTSLRLARTGSVRLALALASLLAAHSAQAAPPALQWDGSDLTTPGAQGGAGTWNVNNTSNWWDGSGDVAWPASGTDNDAIFGGTAGGSVICATVTANDLTFNTTGYNLSGGITLNGGTTPVITTAASTSTTISAAITGTLGLTKEGAGTLILSSANPNYSGLTTVNAGVLQAGNATAFGSATNANLAFGAASTGKVQLNGNSMTVIGLNTNATVGTPIVENGHASTAATLTINNATDNTFAGVLQKGAGGNLSLIKTGAGKLTLTGNSGAASIGGPVTVNAGSFEISGGGQLYSGSNTASNIGSGASDSNIVATITGTGTAASSMWRNSGEIRVGLSGSNNTLTISNGGKLYAGGGTDHITIGYNSGSNNNTITVTGVGSSLVAEDYLQVGRQGTGATLNIENGASASCYLFWSSGGTGNPSGSSSSTVKVDGAGSTFAVTGTWDIADRGTGNLFKVLNGGVANMAIGAGYVGYYTGNVTVLVDGTNSVWNTAAVDWANGGNSAPATVSNNGRWNANGQITLKNNNAVNLNGGANGPGELNIQTLNLAAAGGRLNFNGGRLIAQSPGSLVNGAGQIDLKGAAYIKTDYTKSIANLIYDVGSLTKEGTGTLTLSNTSNSYSGGTIVNGGTLAISGGAGALGATTGNLTLGGGALDLGTFSRTVGAVSITAAAASGDTIKNGSLTGTSYAVSNASGNAVISANLLANGAAGLTKTELGTATLAGTGANTYSGLTTVTLGELDLNKTAAVDAIAGDVLINGGTLKLLASDQIKNTSTVTMSSGAFNLNGKNETITAFSNNGGAFTTGAGTLIGTGATVTWAGGTNTVNNGGSVQDAHLVISGGTNTVEGGATGGVLQLNNGGSGLEMSNGSTLTLNSDNAVAGKLLLQGDVSTSGNSTVTIANSGSNTYLGNIDLDGGTRTFTVADGAASTDLLVSAIITNGGLIKSGAGTLTLTGANTYGGGTTLSAGTLLVDGSLIGAGTVNGGILGGTGSIAGAVTVNGGIISPGASIESLSTGALTMNGGTFAYEMNSSVLAPVGADLLKVTSVDGQGYGVTLNGTVKLTLTDLATSPHAFAPNTVLSLVSYVGNWNEGFFTYDDNTTLNQLTDGEIFTAGANRWKISYGATAGGLNFWGDYNSGGKFINLTLTAVPEPGSLLALGCLVGSGALLRSRRRKE